MYSCQDLYSCQECCVWLWLLLVNNNNSNLNHYQHHHNHHEHHRYHQHHQHHIINRWFSSPPHHQQHNYNHYHSFTIISITSISICSTISAIIINKKQTIIIQQSLPPQYIYIKQSKHSQDLGWICSYLMRIVIAMDCIAFQL